MQGIDYSFGRPSSPSAVKRAGYGFVCRYLGGSASKDLTIAEAKDLVAAGLDIVANWESSANRALGGHAAGVSDAHEALTQITPIWQALGVTRRRPIYFSVDFDASSAQQPAINAYFDGVISVLGLDRTGAYGGYPVITRLASAGKIHWSWQTYAWSSGHWYDKANIRQVRNGVTIAGCDSDINEATTADFGQWGQEDPDMDQQEFKDVTIAVPQGAAVGLTREKDGTARNASILAYLAIYVGAINSTLNAVSAALQAIAQSHNGLTDQDRQTIQEATAAVTALSHQLSSP